MNQDPAQPSDSPMRVRVDERNIATHYSNAFRPNATGGEVALDFGINLPRANPQSNQQEQPQAEMQLQMHSRIVMNYQTTKRLAMALGQLVQRYEQQYGELPVGRQQPQQQQSNGNTGWPHKAE